MKYRISFLETLLLAALWLASIGALYFAADWYLADEAAEYNASARVIE